MTSRMLPAWVSEHTHRSLTQAAAAVGFYDQAHLTRHFERIVGLTPGRYVSDEGGT